VASPLHGGSAPIALTTGAVAQDGLEALESQGMRQVPDIAEATEAASKLMLWRKRMLRRDGAVDDVTNPPLDGETEWLQGQGVGDGFVTRVPGVPVSGDVLGDDTCVERCGRDGSRSLKLARWRRRRRGHDGVGAQKALLGDAQIDAREAAIERGLADGDLGNGVDASQVAHMRHTVWRHVLPDLKSLGWRFQHGPPVLFVLRVFVRWPGEGAEGAGHGAGLSGASSAAIASSQVVEVFAHMH